MHHNDNYRSLQQEWQPDGHWHRFPANEALDACGGCVMRAGFYGRARPVHRRNSPRERAVSKYRSSTKGTVKGFRASPEPTPLRALSPASDQQSDTGSTGPGWPPVDNQSTAGEAALSRGAEFAVASRDSGDWYTEFRLAALSVGRRE